MVHAIGRNVIDHDAPDLQRFERAPGPAGIGSENAGLQAERRIVHRPDRRVEILEGGDGHERGEGLLAVHLHLVRRPGEDGGLEHRPVAPAAGKHLRTSRHRFADPRFDPLGISPGNQGTDIGGLIQRVPHPQRADQREEQLEEGVVHPFLDEDPLHGNARLPRVGVAAGSDPLRCVGQIRSGAHHHGRVSPQLQGHPLLPCPPLQLPTHGGATREGQHLEALVHHERLGTGGARGHHVEGAGRSAGGSRNLAQKDRGRGGLRGGLEDDRVSRREGGSDLVGRKVQGKVEGGDAGDRAQGETPRQADPARPPGHDIEGDHLAADAVRLLRSGPECVHAALRLDACGPQWLACLQGDQAGQLLLPRGDLIRHGRQYRGPLMGGHAAGRFEGLHGRADGGLDIPGPRAMKPRDSFPSVGRSDLEDLRSGPDRAADEWAPFSNDRHGAVFTVAALSRASDLRNTVCVLRRL